MGKKKMFISYFAYFGCHKCQSIKAGQFLGSHKAGKPIFIDLFSCKCGVVLTFTTKIEYLNQD